MTTDTISQRVLAYLKERPGSAIEIAKSLALVEREDIGYYWGKWSFSKAEDDGLIEWKEDKWYLREVGQ